MYFKRIIKIWRNKNHTFFSFKSWTFWGTFPIHYILHTGTKWGEVKAQWVRVSLSILCYITGLISPSYPPHLLSVPFTSSCIGFLSDSLLYFSTLTYKTVNTRKRLDVLNQYSLLSVRSVIALSILYTCCITPSNAWSLTLTYTILINVTTIWLANAIVSNKPNYIKFFPYILWYIFIKLSIPA